MSGQDEDLVNEFDQLWDEMLPLLTASGYDKFASLKGKLTAAAKRVEELEKKAAAWDAITDMIEAHCQPEILAASSKPDAVDGYVLVYLKMKAEITSLTSQLAALKAVAKGAIVEGATDGEWVYGCSGTSGKINIFHNDGSDMTTVGRCDHFEDAAQTCAAVNAIRQIAATTTNGEGER